MIDGKIKLKSGSAIKRYTKTGLEFEDGSTVDTDVIMFATGCVLSYPCILSLLRLYLLPSRLCLAKLPRSITCSSFPAEFHLMCIC